MWLALPYTCRGASEILLHFSEFQVPLLKNGTSHRFASDEVLDASPSPLSNIIFTEIHWSFPRWLSSKM